MYLNFYLRLTEVDSLSNVVNDILINEINQKDGVFRHDNISIHGKTLVGEELRNSAAGEIV